MAKTPIQRLNVWRFKAGTSADDAWDSSIKGLASFAFDAGDGVVGTLVTRQSAQRTPDWVAFLQSGIGASVPGLKTQSASALVLIEAGGRLYGITYGSSRYWLSRVSIERRFGMMVTLNSVEENSIRSVDREEFESFQRKTRTQTSFRSDIEQFGIDIQRDLLRSVTGKPVNASFAEQLTGADNLAIATRVTFKSLPDKLVEIGELANSDAYKTRGYEWIDHFNRVTDPSLIARLDNKLVADVRDRNFDNMFLAAPSTLDFQDHIGFLFPRERTKTSERRPDLNIEDWRARVNDADVSLERLKADRVRYFKINEDEPSDTFSIYDAIVYETKSQTTSML